MEDIFIGYCRVSSTEQLKGHGIQRQKDKIKELAKNKGQKIIQWYVDDFTGREEERPALNRLLLDIKDLQTIGKVNVVIEDNHRLARESITQELIVIKFLEKDVLCWSADSNIEITEPSPNNKFIRQIMGAVSELDKNMIVAKLYAAREGKRKRLIAEGKRGKVEGKKGYWELCPRAHGDCMWLYYYGRVEWFGRKSKEVFGYGRIAKVLNDMGYRTLTGGKFTKYITRSIIQTDLKG